MLKFSPKLIKQLQEYFRKKYGMEINTDEADVFLGSLATVYDALTKEAHA